MLVAALDYRRYILHARAEVSQNYPPDTILMHETKPANWRSFAYRDFYDVPRIIGFIRDERCYVLRCSFDEATDDYEAEYEVFAVAFRSLEDLPDDWDELELTPARLIGRIAVHALRFDPSRRKVLDTSFLDRLRT